VGNEDATARPIILRVGTPDDIQPVSKEATDQSASVFIDDAISQKQEVGTVAHVTENSEASKTPSTFFGEDDEKFLTSMPSIKRKEILDLLSEKEHHLIVKKLFFNDEPAFQGAVTEISLLGTWDSVAQYLEMLFRANEVNPFSKVAVLFTDKLFAHYHSSSAEG
jgi:hypothetical protein